MLSYRSWVASVLVSVCVAHASASIIYVNGDCGNDAWSGKSQACQEPDGPKATIQAGIGASADGDTVIVADGTYIGVGNKNLDFAGRLITLRSENGPAACIIDCEDDGRGFYFHNAETADAVLDGFDIRNGHVTVDSPGGRHGGGIYCLNSSPTISNCDIQFNRAGDGPDKARGGHGGGIYGDTSSATISQCTISNNEAGTGGPGSVGQTAIGYRGGDGGGLYFVSSSVTFTDCTISNNVAGYGGQTDGDIGGPGGHGGGISCDSSSSLTITRCTISKNAAGAGSAACCGGGDGGYGGGIHCADSPLFIVDCVISLNDGGAGHGDEHFGGAGGHGGGIYCSASPLTIINSTVASNTGGQAGAGDHAGPPAAGGGIYCTGSSAIIRGCTISANRTPDSPGGERGAGSGGGGGGIYMTSASDSRIMNCQFSDNSTGSAGHVGGSAGNGGNGAAIRVEGVVTISNCLITDNITGNGSDIAPDRGGDGGMGGGIWAYGTVTVSACVIAANTTGWGGWGPNGYGMGGRGGGIWAQGNLTVTNCRLTGNKTRDGGEPIPGGDGAGIYVSAGNSTISNSTFSGNACDRKGVGGGIRVDNDSNASINNCVFWSDTPDEISVADGTATVSYSDVAGGWDGEGNIDADPRFVDPQSGVYRLSPGSPCIDAANNEAVPDGIEFDLDRKPRFVDDPDTQDTGKGDPPIVDMGAYEFQTCDPCDTNCDGSVDLSDVAPFIGLLLGGGEPCAACAGDANFDGSIDLTDVERFIECLLG